MDLNIFNFCKLFFATITLSLVILSCLMNAVEPYLPVFITRTFRYGKHANKADSWLVKQLEVPKSYFRHFYITSALIYCPVAFYQVSVVYVKDGDVSGWLRNLLDLSCGTERKATVPATYVFIAVTLMLLQVLRRFYDTCFVSIFSEKAKINLCHYIIGMVYYVAVTISILSEAPKFTRENSANISNTLRFEDVGVVEIFAITLFVWAWYHQHVATVILANLRKNDRGVAVSQDYKIPNGDWFCYLSSPHCTAEILMYTALTVLLKNNSSWWYVYMWVLCNQVETIFLSHWWYQEHFKNFPKERKALIPFIY